VLLLCGVSDVTPGLLIEFCFCVGFMWRFVQVLLLWCFRKKKKWNPVEKPVKNNRVLSVGSLAEDRRRWRGRGSFVSLVVEPGNGWIVRLRTVSLC
jgi:hypothetical protein